MRTRRRLISVSAVAATAAVALLAGALAFAAYHVADRATATTFTPGSPGLGDPYFPHEGNGGYDVSHYDLRLTYGPASHLLSGSDTVTAVARQNLSRFDLDLSGYTVSAVLVDGSPATFTRAGQELVVTPAAGLPRGHRFRVRVQYAGQPRTITGSPLLLGAPYGWIYTKDGAFVGCEPNAAHTWYPSNDHPSDKASFRIAMTVPSTRQVIANGTLADRRSSDGMTTYVWREDRPMATYLATVDIGRWQIHSTRTGAGIPELTALDPTLATQARPSHTTRMTARITDYWVSRFGRYPFGSTGAIVDHVPNVRFSLETQTRPLYGFVPDDGTAAHELSHQWFGDSVSVRTWQDIWLNEGFATFSSWLWAEHAHGFSALTQARDLYRSYGPKNAFWKQPIADPGRNRMFSPAVYLRGGMTLEALRHRIGDKHFFTLLRTWARQHRYGNATTAQFTRLAHRVSGVPLYQFFHVWLWQKAKPPHL